MASSDNAGSAMFKRSSAISKWRGSSARVCRVNSGSTLCLTLGDLDIPASLWREIPDDPLNRGNSSERRPPVTYLSKSGRATRMNEVAIVLCLVRQDPSVGLDQADFASHFHVLVQSPSFQI